MIQQLEDGTPEYKTSNYLKSFFNDKINQPFKNKPLTSSWRKEVIEPYKKREYTRIREVIDGGQADFDQEYNRLTPKERVLLYCYAGNFEQHLVSQMYIFENHNDIFKQYISAPNQVVFIDFGCGPATSGVAIARYYAESASDVEDPLIINYVGIDSSNAMLEKAQEFCKYPSLFHEDSNFRFIPVTSDKIDLLEYLDTSVSKESVILLNFSYLFASATLIVQDLVEVVQRLSNKYPNRMVLLFQNPYGPEYNEKWYQFKALMTNFRSVVGGERYIKICYRTNTGDSVKLRDTKLYYDIRVTG